MPINGLAMLHPMLRYEGDDLWVTSSFEIFDTDVNPATTEVMVSARLRMGKGNVGSVDNNGTGSGQEEKRRIKVTYVAYCKMNI